MQLTDLLIKVIKAIWISGQFCRAKKYQKFRGSGVFCRELSRLSLVPNDQLVADSRKQLNRSSVKAVMFNGQEFGGEQIS